MLFAKRGGLSRTGSVTGGFCGFARSPDGVKN